MQRLRSPLISVVKGARELSSTKPLVSITTDEGIEVMRVAPSGKVGISTTTPTHPLHVNANTGIRQNSLYISGGAGWSSLSYNAHHDEANGQWVFADPSHKAVTIEMDDAAGSPRFQVLSTTTQAPTKWVQRLAVDGNSGNVLMGQNGGNVGIGTTAPVSRLQVGGDLTLEKLTPGSLNVGGANGWGDPGGGNAWFSGSVGIGTTTPARKLHVENTEIHSGGSGVGFSFGNRQTAAFVEAPGSGERWVWYSSQGTARLWSATDKIAITSAGNVGIGTTTPRNPLGIRGTGAAQELLSFEDPSGTTKWHINQALGGKSGLNFVETGVADGRLFIQAGGNVGIGTTTPNARLNVVNGGAVINGVAIGTDVPGIDYPYEYETVGVSDPRMNLRLQSPNSIFFHTGSKPPAESKLTITSTGNVGIGLTGPRTQLHVFGRIATGLDFHSPGSITFYPPDGFAWFHIDNGPAGGRPIGTLRFSSGGNPGDAVIMSMDQRGSVNIPGSLWVTGPKHFVEEHPTDPTKQIVYASLEGGEAGTYTRGTWKLENGKAVIELSEHFGMVTSEDGLTVQLTPHGEWLQLYVMQLTTRQLLVREAQGRSGQFDYLVQGMRKGYEHYEVIRQREEA